jgi:osmotically-inducible protein OsmY
MSIAMMRKRFSNLALACQLFAATGSVTLVAQDRDSGQVTADQQKGNKADRELTQKIRKSVVSDKSLSMSAHNVKIISQDGMVTLRGTVKSDDEPGQGDKRAHRDWEWLQIVALVFPQQKPTTRR